MYADRVEAEVKRSVKERLNGSMVGDSGRRRPVTGKRQRQDYDKWEHDLYDDDEPQVSDRKLGARDLRVKLQKKGLQQALQSGKGSLPGVQDLREKLSGTMHSQPVNNDPPKPKSVVESVKSARKSVTIEASLPETKKAANPARKKTQQKTDTVDSFLQSLGLEKYSITFQAEEVDMTALVHMSDEDLKALGVPMGPRKKIRLALDSRA
ncbi:uncharacterized protein LOC131155226 [Malania oleifera]|uniref:uncharacterized protein LOC131155226 n=1 Tax=Malania oleifera TaxID=397392 RepID=UPI0025AE4542|nr:uncharacterized protein LOC131155226 [Malania oleifera]